MDTNVNWKPEDHTIKATEVSKRNLLLFFVLLVLLSLPIWVISSFFGDTLPLPVKLPTSTIVILVPAVAASILSYRESGASGLKALWKRVFDFHKIKNKRWLWAAVLSTPLIHFLSYLWLRWTGAPLPEPIIFPIHLAPLFFVAFFIGAIFEELGWTGYVYDPLELRLGALGAGILVGVAWALWHFVGDLQVGNPASWILWHRLSTIALRIIMVWIYNNSGKSLFTAILVHAMVNVSDFLFPNFGSHYDPFSNLLFSLILVAVAILGWGAQSLSHYRFARAIR